MSRKAIVTVLAICVALALLAPGSVVDYLSRARVTYPAMKADVPGRGRVEYGWYQSPVLFHLRPSFYYYLTWARPGDRESYLVLDFGSKHFKPSMDNPDRMWVANDGRGVWLSHDGRITATLDFETGEFLDHCGNRMDPAFSLAKQSREPRGKCPQMYPPWANPKKGKIVAEFTREDYWEVTRRVNSSRLHSRP